MNGSAEVDEYPEIAEAIAEGFGQDRLPDPADTVSTPRPDDQAARLRAMVAEIGEHSAPHPHERSAIIDAARLRSSPPVVPRRGLSDRIPSAPLVAIASGKGGVGKSTIALNIAAAARRACTLVDLDLGTANLDVMCGLSPSRRMDTELFNANGPDLERMVIRTAHGFGLIPGAAGVAGAANLDAIQRQRLLEAVQSLGAAGETVIADLGAGIGASVVETIAAADLGLIVTTPDPSAIADAYAIIKCVVHHRGDPRPLRMGVVVTMVSRRSEAKAAHGRIDRVCRRFLGGTVPMLGMVRRDARVVQAARRREPLLASRTLGPAARDLRGLADLVDALAPRCGRARAHRTQPES